jgi:hypothetical protein
MAGRRARGSFACPHCGAEVPRGRPACPECGSDAETGWSDEAELGAADLPDGYAGDEDFDYDEFVRREVEGGGRRVLGMPPWLVALLAGAVVAGLVVLLLGG